MNMNILRDEVRKTSDGYEILIYLAPEHTEFARELGRGNGGGNEKDLDNDVQEYVKRKYPNLRASVAKVMLGGLLVASVPLGTAGVAGAAAAPVDMDKTSDWAKQSVARLVEQNIIVGDQYGKFNPQGSMSREAFVTMLVKSLGLELVNPATATFKDVPKNAWSYQYVETAFQNGLIAGTSVDQFSPTSNVTREQMAAIYVRALGLTPADLAGKGDQLTFTDKSEISEYARDAVGFAVENGILVGMGDNEFGGGATATREQVAVLADRFLTNKDKLVTAAGQLKAASFTAAMSADDLSTVTLTFNKPVDALSAGDVKITDPNGNEVGVSNVTLNADKTAATVTTDRLTAGLAYSITVSTDKIKGQASVTPQSTVVTYASVSAPSNKQVLVTFSGKVNKDTAETLSNYVFSGDAAKNGTFSPEAAYLQDNGNTVMLILPDANIPENQNTLDLDVSGVEDLNGNTVAKDSKSVDFTDLTFPTAQSMTVTGPNTLKVTFSEPIQKASASDFQLDDGTVSVSFNDTDYNHRDNSLTLTVGTDLSEGAHKLVVAPKGGGTTATDYAGFKLSEKSLDFNYVADVTAPQLGSVVSADPSSVTVKFSKPVKVETVHTANFYHTYAGYTPNSVKPATEGATYDDTFTLTFTDHLLPPGNVSLHVLKGDTDEEQIKDAWGNTFAADQTVTVSVTQDLAAPKVSSVVAKDDQTVNLTFNKDVVQADAENPENYTFLDNAGNPVDATGFNADGQLTAADAIKYDATKKIVTFTLPEALPGGTYKIVARDITDKAVEANKMTESTTTFSVKDTTAPTVPGDVSYASDSNQIIVNYSEPMAVTGTGSILDKTKYLFNGGDLPDGTTISAGNNNKSAIIKLPRNTAMGDTPTLTIGRVADANGNNIASLSTQKEIKAATGPTAMEGRAFATGKRTVTMEVDQPLTSITTAGFTVNGKAVGNVKFTNQMVGADKNVDGALITLTLTEDIDSATPGKIAIANATGTKNLFNTPIQDVAEVTIADKIAPVLQTDGALFIGADTIQLKMSEPLAAETFAARGVNGFSVSTGTLDSATYANSVVTLKGSGFTKNTKVSYNGTAGITDPEGNALPAITSAALVTPAAP